VSKNETDINNLATERNLSDQPKLVPTDVENNAIPNQVGAWERRLDFY